MTELNNCPLCKEAGVHEVYDIGGNMGTQHSYGCNECGIYLDDLDDWQSLTTTEREKDQAAALKASEDRVKALEAELVTAYASGTEMCHEMLKSDKRMDDLQGVLHSLACDDTEHFEDTAKEHQQVLSQHKENE